MSVRLRIALALAAASACAVGVIASAHASGGHAARRAPRVLRVGTFHGVRGQFRSVQAAVRAARPGDWILIAPGDYHERGTRGAGVLIRKARLRIRGMDRNRVVIDGTRRGARPCSSRRRDQVFTRRGRNGIVAFKVSGVSISNLTVCNFLTNAGGDEGNEIWWNGGDGSGRIGMRSWHGDYLTATSTYSKGANPPFGDYGIFISNARGPGKVDHSYASNMGDAAFYVGACPDCNATVVHAHGQGSALGFSGTNAGGHLVIERSEFDHNKSGPTTNSQNNEDAPSPQVGLCPGSATASCDVWHDNLIHDNNNANVPGSGRPVVAGLIPVGTGVVLGGTRYVTLSHNRIYNNKAWGLAVADFPDQEGPSPLAGCRGGTYLTPSSAQQTVCYYQAFGNVVRDNFFSHNGAFGNPTNGDIVLYAQAHAPGNCFFGNVDPAGLSSDPSGIQSPPYNPCGQANGNTDANASAQLICALRLGPCPPGTHYPAPARSFRLPRPPLQRTMPNPCAGVPANPWCPRRRR